jgi:hypothetical protein
VGRQPVQGDGRLHRMRMYVRLLGPVDVASDRGSRPFAGSANRTGQAMALADVGYSHAMLGNIPQALSYCEQALPGLPELDPGPAQLSIWDTLATPITSWAIISKPSPTIGGRSTTAVRSETGSTKPACSTPSATFCLSSATLTVPARPGGGRCRSLRSSITLRPATCASSSSPTCASDRHLECRE